MTKSDYNTCDFLRAIALFTLLLFSILLINFNLKAVLTPRWLQRNVLNLPRVWYRTKSLREIEINYCDYAIIGV